MMSSMTSSTNSDVRVNGDESFKVAIRVRPLNKKEMSLETKSPSAASRVWRVLPKYNAVTQTTREGKPLPERVQGRSFFTFDKTFGKNYSTRQVYDDIVRRVVQSTMTGLNGTIFTYGQKNSGKTFTMQGGGSIEDVTEDGGGIIHMTARDIFSHIAKEHDRVFLIRVSYVEIYNEEVRDLLVSKNGDNVIAIREDPQQGVIVNSKENIVTDFESLLGTFSAGEKKRSVSSTTINERSSQSHTIFRITIESRGKSMEAEDSRNDNDNENEVAVQISTLNFVDLVGSESIRHIGATGDKEKEEGQIDRSLLKLSQVITALGSSSKSDINFRDSKLTRILQPDLSGNSRMAIICCATPLELCLEETRSTFQFASRAKLIKTRAQINKVLDDRSLIKKLQRQLAEARFAIGGKDAILQLRALEIETADAKSNTIKAEETIQQLKDSILKGGILPISKKRRSSIKHPSLLVYNARNNIFTEGLVSPVYNKLSDENNKRRKSDGELPVCIRQFTNPMITRSDIFDDSFRSPMVKPINKPFSTTQKVTGRKIGIHEHSTNNFSEYSLLREALTAKGKFVQNIQSKLAKSEEISMNEKALLLEATTQIEILNDCKKESDSLFSTITEEKLSLEKTIREKSVNEKGQHENKLLKGKILETEKEMKRLMKSLTRLKNKYESNKNTIVAITTERDDAMELSDKLSENEDTLIVNINRLVVDNKTLETKMTDAEITLLANADEIERTRNNALVLTQEKIENEKVMRDNTLNQDIEMQSLMKSLTELKRALTELKNECESNKNTIVAIRTERDDAMELCYKLSNNEDSLSANINRLVFDNKTLETKMTDAEITLSAKNEELERIRNDAIVLTQDEIENEKVMRDKNISQKTLMESLTELQNKYESNKNTIVAITTERDDAMELSEKLSENEDSLSVNINRLVFDNKTLETKMTVAEITLLNKNIELERIRNDVIVLTQEKIENEKIMRDKNVSQDNEMQSLMKSLTELRNECESNKNTIVAITTERDDAMVLSEQLSENDEDRVKEIDTLILNIKTLETKMTDAEMKLSAKDIELERIRNDTLVLTQEKIENEKIMREKVVIKDNQIEEFLNKVSDLKKDCESNENNIVAIITERDDAMKLSDKLSKNDEDRVKEINRLIVINKTLETKMTDAEITLLANDEELERIRNNAIALTQEKIENEKIMREKDVIQDNQIEEFVSKVADLKNECESNKNTIVAITSERNNAMELSEKLSENDEDRVKEINHLIIDNKTLKKEMTDAEMKLSAKGIELERIRKDAIVLKQEKIENEKMMREKDVIQDNKMQEFITKITELKQTCESNKNAIIAITSERDDAMELSDKLSENDEDRVKEINRLVFDNKIYETRATNAEIALSTKNDEIERIRNDTIILTQEKTENEKIMREKDVSQDKEMQEFVTKITELKNECESNKNTIAAITTERDDALELSDKLSDNDKDRVKEMNTLFVNIKSLETKVTNTEITLSAKDIELERIRNDALVLKQEKIENEKIMIEKTFNQDNEMQEFVTKITELKNECESNKIIIVAITSERDDAMELSDKLTENDEDRVKEINRLIFDNKTLETKMNDTEITLSAKNVELKEKDIKLLKYTRHGSEHDTNLRVTSEKLTSLEDEVRNKENFGDPLLQRSVLFVIFPSINFHNGLINFERAEEWKLF